MALMKIFDKLWLIKKALVDLIYFDYFLPDCATQYGIDRHCAKIGFKFFS